MSNHPRPQFEARSRLTREKIAAAALAIADSEGFEAVSMRRVAAELGAGTMTLYHYVRNKAELLALMHDAIMGELLVPDGELPSDWREALATIARRTRAAFKHHRWAVEGLRGAQAGPNAMVHVEQSLAAVASTGLDAARQLELIMMVDDYVVGFATREGEISAVDDDALTPFIEYVDSQLRNGSFPHLQNLLGSGDPRDSLKRLAAVMFEEGRFERGLARLLNGIELEVESARAG